jgi:hypothetical protein
MFDISDDPRPPELTPARFAHIQQRATVIRRRRVTAVAALCSLVIIAGVSVMVWSRGTGGEPVRVAAPTTATAPNSSVTPSSAPTTVPRRPAPSLPPALFQQSFTGAATSPSVVITAEPWSVAWTVGCRPTSAFTLVMQRLDTPGSAPVTVASVPDASGTAGTAIEADPGTYSFTGTFTNAASSCTWSVEGRPSR